ncbi:MAG TPA: cytochrome C oxidase subunit I [Gammaproteobacteria bacterium]|nr:cytochrome C oxidase subunit I [Gammaproteobacteria bacterium]
MSENPPSAERLPAFPVEAGVPRRLAVGWLSLGLAALVASGLFSVLLVLSRTPAIQEYIPLLDFFHVALVVHVDLSVLIWFLSFAGVLWSLAVGAQGAAWGWSALALGALGTAIIALAPFAGAGNPLMNNYVPVLDHPLFLAGLGVFGTGFALLVVRTLLTPAPADGARGAWTTALRFAMRAAALTAAIALMALAWSWLDIPADMQGQGYYEFLFWGSGHILQFTHTLLLLVAWVWMAHACGAKPVVSRRTLTLLFALAASPVLLALPIYLGDEVASLQHRLEFTQLMKYGGLATFPAIAVILFSLPATRRVNASQRPARAALFASLLLFGAGGILGYMIEGVNVVIPAHYHGSIVGVTLAFMGLTYHLLPQLGFGAPAPRLATIQPWVYGGGQLLHILGLAWSGGYGVQRKTAGAAQGLDSMEKIIGMGMMGLGGLIAIIGGLLFVIVALGAMWRRQSR